MKVNEILCKILILAVLIIICTSNICFAGASTNYEPELGGGTPPQTNTSNNGSQNINYSDYKPLIDGGGTGIISKLLGALIVIGVVVIVVSIALIGFNSILGSASEKALGQEKLMGIFIAAILLTGLFTIVKFLVSAAEQIV